MTTTGKHHDRSQARWWKLYRHERSKLGPFNTALTTQQITHAARAATRRFNEETS